MLVDEVSRDDSEPELGDLAWCEATVRSDSHMESCTSGQDICDLEIAIPKLSACRVS
jgi:hypothetical protein